MLWVLWDIVLPILLAFLVGLLIGFLLWRWRRREFDSESIQDLRRDNARYRSDIQQLRARNAQLAERRISDEYPVAAVDNDELAPLKARNQTLIAELKASQEQVQQLRNTLSGGASKYQQASRLRTRDSSSDDSASQLVSLRDAVAVRDKMISTLQLSLDQYGDQSDLTALSAELAMRERKIDALENMLAQVRH